MNQVLERNRDTTRRVAQDNVVGLSARPTKRKHVSYNIYEGHIQDIENKLMHEIYRCGYSALHKRLVREKAEQISDKNFWTT